MIIVWPPRHLSVLNWIKHGKTFDLVELCIRHNEGKGQQLEHETFCTWDTRYSPLVSGNISSKDPGLLNVVTQVQYFPLSMGNISTERVSYLWVVYMYSYVVGPRQQN